MDTNNQVPLTPQSLLQVLQAASSSSQELVRSASAQLKGWETSDQALWSLLQEAYLDQSLPLEIRWIALLQLKNGVDRYWRKSAQNSIPKERKAVIRHRLLSSVNEPVPQLAVQNAVIIAKISRIDYPLEWPTIFNQIISVVRTQSEETSELPDVASNAHQDSILRLTRALQILLHVIKEQASGKLPRTKSQLQTIAPEMFRVLGGVYIKFVNLWTSMPSPAPELMAISLFCIKILRRLLVSGYEFPNRVDEVKDFWRILHTHLASFLALTETPGPHVQAARKHVVGLGKIFLNVNSSHQSSFALMPGTLDLVRYYWSMVVNHGEMLSSTKPIGGRRSNGVNGKSEGPEDEEDEKLQEFREKVALQGMLLFRGCIKMVFNPTQTFKYRYPQEKEEQKLAVNLFKTDLFTPDTVTQSMEVLVTKYFMLRKSDLEGWEQDPETWVVQWEDATESWEFMIRPCAEKLFNDLVVNFKSLLIEPLKRVFDSVATLGNHDILLKDAVYTAIGLAGAVLEPVVDFDVFLNNILVQEVQITQPWYNILRRRIAILIGQWVSIKISDESRSTIYQITQHLFNKTDPLNDLVVRLTAARNLRKSVDEWEFKKEDFVPFADSLLQSLLSLMDEVETTEAKMNILSVIGVIVDRLEEGIGPYAERIISVIPPLWEQTGEEHLFKQSILVVLSQIVTAIKADSVKFHNLMLPLIRHSIDEEAGMQVYLQEDALDLWDATIRSTPSPAAPELLSLFPLVLPLLQQGAQDLKKVLEIIEAYVLLAPREIITHYREALFREFSALILGSLKSDLHAIVTSVIEIVIRMVGENEDVVQEIVKGLLGSGFLLALCDKVYHAWDAEQTPGPKKKSYPQDTKIMTDCINVLSRLVLASTRLFVEAMQWIGEQKRQSLDLVMKWLLDEWFSQFGNLGNPRTRKLNALALTKLLETNQSWILIKLQDLITIWTDIINEIKNDEGNEDLIYWNTDQKQTNRTPHKARQHELAMSDPVQTAGLAEWIKHFFQKAQTDNGGPNQFREEWIVNVDSHVLDDFAKLGVL